MGSDCMMKPGCMNGLVIWNIIQSDDEGHNTLLLPASVGERGKGKKGSEDFD